jgi:hypothetical protein
VAKRKVVNFSKSYDELCRLFSDLGISIDAPGFYDDPAFVAIERENPKLLEAYGAFVKARPLDDGYVLRVRQIVNIVSPVLHKELVLDGRIGACIDLSMVLSRILENEGVWNYMVMGALTIEYPKSSGYDNSYLWPIDVSNAKTGHSWVCVPPYPVIDLTIHQQPFKGTRQRYIPDFILTDSCESVNPSIFDICSPDVLEQLYKEGYPIEDETLFKIKPHLKDFFRSFPSTLVNCNATIFRYIPCAISASDAPLKEITSLKLRGKTGYEIYQDKLKTLLDALKANS